AAQGRVAQLIGARTAVEGAREAGGRGAELEGVAAGTADQILEVTPVNAVKLAFIGTGDGPGVGDVGAHQRIGATAAVEVRGDAGHGSCGGEGEPIVAASGDVEGGQASEVDSGDAAAR